MPFFLGREEPPALLTATRRSAFARPTSTRSATTAITSPSSRCSATRSGSTSRRGAIELAREFIQERLKLDWDRVWVTIHAGDPGLELGPDEVAIKEWEAVGMPPERIVPLPSSENFWSVAVLGRGPDSRSTGTGAPSTAAATRTCRPPALRPLPRVLEPRLHGVRAASGRDARHRCRSRTSTRGWGSSGWRRSSRTCRTGRSTRPTATRRSWTGSRPRAASRSATRRRRPRPIACSPTTAAG